MKSYLILLPLLLVFLNCKNEKKELSNSHYEIINDLISQNYFDKNKSLALNPKVLNQEKLSVYIHILEKEKTREEKVEQVNQANLEKSILYKSKKIEFDTSYFQKIAPSLSKTNWNLTKKKTLEMINQLSQLDQNKKFDNSILKFNNKNHSYSYQISIPIFTKDKKNVYLEVEEICPGFCALYKNVLLSKNQNGIWEEIVLFQAVS